MKIGVGQADISPEPGIAGRLGLQHPLAAGDPIKAKALYFDSVRSSAGRAPAGSSGNHASASDAARDNAGGAEGNHMYRTHEAGVLQITAEIVGFPRAFRHKVLEAVSGKLGIPADGIILTATHTHCSPWVWELQSDAVAEYGLAIYDRDWEVKVIAGCVEAAEQAVRSADETILRIGAHKVDKIASNRVQHGPRWSITADPDVRAKPEGDIDPDVRVMALYSTSGDPKAVVANYSCHPSGYGGGKTSFPSPDFPYHTELILQKELGREIQLIYWMGCSGNINAGKYVAEGSTEEVARLGERLAGGILGALDGGEKVRTDDCSVTNVDRRYPAGEWIEPIEEVRERVRSASIEAKELIDRGETLAPEIIGRWRSAVKRLDVCTLLDSREMEATIRCMRLGPVRFLFVPGEWFHSYGIRLASERADGSTWTTTLADFDLLYIPDEESMPNREWYGVTPRMRAISDEGVRSLFRDTQDLLRAADANGGSDTNSGHANSGAVN